MLLKYNSHRFHVAFLTSHQRKCNTYNIQLRPCTCSESCCVTEPYKLSCNNNNYYYYYYYKY